MGSAQNGRWVPYDLSTIGASGNGTGVRGDGIVCFTPDNSRYFLIFDVRAAEWLTVDLGSVQDFETIKNVGNVVSAYSDEILFGYSGIGAVWDTVYYSGTILHNQYGFGCSENLAYFMTEQYLYVFDAESGYWSLFDYAFPADYTNMFGWAKDDYVGTSLARTSPAHPANVVYSYHTKGFNEIDQGAYYDPTRMDHGFARFMDGDDHCRLVGYSAYDNEFDVEIYTPVPSEGRIGAFNAGTTPADEFTVCADAFRYAVSYDYVNANHYAYDTRHGEWVHHYLHQEWPDGYTGNCHYAGQMASDFAHFSDDPSPHWIIFDGTNNVFRNPDVSLDLSNSWNFHLGGGCFLSWDSTKAWGYNVAENLGAELNWIAGNAALVYSGQDYQTISRWSSGNDMMRTYFYSSRNNSWQYIDVPEHHNIDGIETAHYYMHSASSENDIVYYSSPLDQIIEYDMPDGGGVYKKIRGDLAYAAGSDFGVLFNGLSGNTATFSFNIRTNSQNGLGIRSAILCDNANNTLHGYSALSGLVTTLNFTEDPFYCLDTGYVGIMSVYYNNNGYNKIYTYNSLADSWIELIPDGLPGNIWVGIKTALVSRRQGGGDPGYVYAFDPQREITGIDDHEQAGNYALPAIYALNQNYPNPFNAGTVIRYELPQQSHVIIEIYDILGRKVTTLTDDLQPPGYHQVIWNAENVSSGVYFYKLQAGNYSETKKMTLVK
jgi:hypothetical protein